MWAPEIGKSYQRWQGAKVRDAAWQARIKTEPASVIKEIDSMFVRQAEKQGPVDTEETQKKAVDYILSIEGGFVENDAGEGPTNFGINSKANPDIDVKNLTKEQAKQIYIDRYFKPSGADKLPPDAALIVADTAVNMGVSFAKQMAADSGGDIEEMTRIRKERYEEIALANPQKAEYLNGWLKRADKTKQEALSLAVGSVTKTEKVQGSSGLVRMTPVNDLVRIRNQADQAVRQNNSVALNAIKARITDSAAMAKEGIPDQDPLSAESFSLFGEQAAEMYSKYNKTQRLARQINKMSGQTNAELVSIINGSDDIASPGQGFAENQVIDNARKQAALQILERRENDPVAFVASTVSEVKNAFDLAETPEQFQSAIAQSLAAQESLGIKNPRLLSSGQVNAYGDKIMMASTPQDVSDFVAGLEQQLGNKHFRAAMGELMEANKLPPALLVIPDLPSAGARDIVAATAFAKLDQLKAGVEKADATQVTELVGQAVSELVQTIPVVEMGAVSMVAAYEETATKLALQMVQRGVSPSDAAERAAKMLWGHYELDGTIRKPQGINFDVQEKASLKIDFDKFNYDVPPDLLGSRNEQEAKNEWVDLIDKHSRLYTNPEGTGVQLWAMGMDGVLYRVTKDGEQVEYTFDELQTVSAPRNRREVRERQQREINLRNQIGDLP
jgi:hypothetical protein